MNFKIQSTPIDKASLHATLARPDAGACVVFEGWVRDHNEGSGVSELEYEAYPELAEKEGARILAEAVEKFGIRTAEAVHRTGRLQVGDLAVWVGVSAGHRGEAFEACRYLIDEIKARVPIWKKEHYAERAAEWVNCATRSSSLDTQ